MAGLTPVWHEAQSVCPVWEKVAGFQALVVWHWLHWPAKWLAGLTLEWHEAQLVWPEWLKVAGSQASVVWHARQSFPNAPAWGSSAA